MNPIYEYLKNRSWKHLLIIGRIVMTVVSVIFMIAAFVSGMKYAEANTPSDQQVYLLMTIIPGLCFIFFFWQFMSREAELTLLYMDYAEALDHHNKVLIQMLDEKDDNQKKPKV